MEAIRTENLTKQYKSITAVDQLNLEIHQGELFCLLGEYDQSAEYALGNGLCTQG